MQTIDTDNRFEKWAEKYNVCFQSAGYFIKAIGVVVILLILIESSSLLIVNIYESKSSGLIANDQRSLENYNGITDNFFIEKDEVDKVKYSPYVGYVRLPNFKGEYYNINNKSIRKTSNPCINNSKELINIFVFGGSTVWGTGARDHGTIPSKLSEQMCLKDYNIKVTNFGEEGYTNTQGMIKLQLELRNNNIPDIVIFYDGVNDVFSSYQHGVAGLSQNIKNREKEFNSIFEYRITSVLPNFNKIIRKISGYSNYVVKFSSDELNIETSEIYLNNIRIINSLGKEFKFKSFFYWQPILSTKDNLSDFEKNIDYNKELIDIYNNVSSIINDSKKVTNLIDIFDDKEETIFIDFAHIHEDGNNIVANRISKDLNKYLKNLEVK